MAKKYSILLFLSLGLFFASLPWYNFSAVAPALAEEFQLSSSQIGAIISAFQIGYVLIVLLTGWLSDKIGPKRVIVGATLLAGIFSTLFALIANTFTSILWLRVLSGLATGAIYVPGMALLTQWFAANERGKALSFFTVAIPLAGAASYLVTGWFAARWGWRAGILATSLPAFIGCLCVVFLVQERRPSQSRTAAAPAAVRSEEVVQRKLSLFVPASLITLAYMGHMWELYGHNSWVGPFLHSSILALGSNAADAVSASTMLASLSVFVGVPATALCGVLADKFGRIRIIMLSSVASFVGSSMLGFTHGHSLGLVIGVSLWLGAWVIADTAMYKAVLTEVVPERLLGTALGVQSVAGFGMTAISPAVFGAMLQRCNPGQTMVEAVLWWPPYLALALPALLAPLAALLLVLWQKRYPGQVWQ